MNNFHKTLNKNYATLEDQIADKFVDVTTLCLEKIQQLNIREEEMYSLFREIKTQKTQRFGSLDTKFNNLVHLFQKKNQEPQRMDEQEIPPRDERHNSVPRQSLERQGFRRPSPMDRNISGFSRQNTSSPKNLRGMNLQIIQPGWF